MEDQPGFSLNSQEIRDKISRGDLVTPDESLEDRIQPASFDPIIGDEIYVLESEQASLFRPRRNQNVRNTLLRLPGRNRKGYGLEGFEIKKGFTYLIPLEEKIRIVDGESVKSSPKSSGARLFISTRLLTDYNVGFDEINPVYRTGEFLNCWLLVQPLALNAILHPGISLNQLRFFNGMDAQLSSREVQDELRKDNLLYLRDEETFTPSDLVLSQEGIQVHLDLTGKHTEGIVGLRARHNPNPIDLGRIGEYEAEDFFEPILRENGIVEIRKGEHYLFASREVLRIPRHLNVELKSSSHIGLRGDIHFAGFIDPGFAGDLVLEIRSHEIETLALTEDFIPISTIDLYRNGSPDKVYGEGIGSHYQGQLGPKVAKYFRKFDYAFAARNNDKLKRSVLTQDATVLMGYREISSGFEPIAKVDVEQLMKDIQDGFFHVRYDCESDEDVLQIVPYCLVFDRNNRVFTYIRGDYEETWLIGRHSIGVGGHIILDDAPDYVRNGLERKLNDEVEIVGRKSDPILLGTLMAYDVPVDRRHFCLVYSLYCDDVKPRSASMHSGKFISIDELMQDLKIDQKYETWSRILIPKLPTLVGIK